jgi:hypothetical protein
MAADDSRFKVLTPEDRKPTIDTRRRALEVELWQHLVNRIGAEDAASFDKRIGEIEAALTALDEIDPSP